MAYIILPSRRTRQPQGFARLSSLITRPQCVILPPSALDVANGAAGSLRGVAKFDVGPAGNAIDITGATGTGDRFDVSGASGNLPGSFTRLHVFSIKSLAYTALSDSNYLDGAGQLIRVETNGAIALIASYQALKAQTAAGVVVPGSVHCLVLSYDNSAGRYCFALDGKEIASGTGATYAWNEYRNFALGTSYATASGDHKHYLFSSWNQELARPVVLQLSANPWQLFAPDSRRIYFGASGGGATTNERTVAARTKARGAATTTAIHAATAAGRLKARGADAVTPIHVETVAGRVTARGADARTSIHASTAAGRVRTRAANTVEHIDADAVSRTIAGKVRARGVAATLAIRHTSIVGRIKAKAAETGTSTRLSLAAGRVRTRAALSTEQLGAGVNTRTVAGRVAVRGAATTLSIRSATVVGRVTARGADTSTSTRLALAAGKVKARTAVTSEQLGTGITARAIAGRVTARGTASNFSARTATAAGRLRLREEVQNASLRVMAVAERLYLQTRVTAGAYVPPTVWSEERTYEVAATGRTYEIDPANRTYTVDPSP